jgi:Helix-turn-helix domain
MVAPMTAETTEAPISAKEFATRTGISYRLVIALIDSGEIPVLRFPSREGALGKRRMIRIEAREVHRFLERARKAGTAS